MSVTSGTARGTGGGTRGGSSAGVPAELKAELFRPCSALLTVASSCQSVRYDAGGTTELICAHTPPYPPARERPEGRRAGWGACARARSMFHGSSAASARRDGGGNGRAIGHSLFCVSGFPASVDAPGPARARPARRVEESAAPAKGSRPGGTWRERGVTLGKSWKSVGEANGAMQAGTRPGRARQGEAERGVATCGKAWPGAGGSGGAMCPARPRA